MHLYGQPQEQQSHLTSYVRLPQSAIHLVYIHVQVDKLAFMLPDLEKPALFSLKSRSRYNNT